MSPEGFAVTNNHVIQGSGEAEITVALSDGREFPAKVILKDERTDLVVLRLSAAGVRFPSIEFSDSDSLEVGDLVLAIGDPFGVGQTVTSGIVSALARTQVGISDYQFFIQTDAAINPGNSGGALVDMDGHLSASTPPSSRAAADRRASDLRFLPTWCGSWFRRRCKGGTVQRPWFGASLQPVTQDLAESLGLDRPGGALIKDLRQGPSCRGRAESRRRGGERRWQACAGPGSFPIPVRHQGAWRHGRARLSSAEVRRWRRRCSSFPLSRIRRGTRTSSQGVIR